ncbi:MAG: PEP-CTERM sorting domain-containing protein [Pseudomonadota bacterium]|nr:PEP-CTERM sorting domain-containing protein [Pseudomonadota bacterium]
MKLNKITLLTATLAATLGYGASASATTIDLFNDPATPLVNFVEDNNNAVGPVAQQFDGSAGGTIIGGYRDLIIDALSGANAARGASLSVDSGFLSYNNDSGVASEATIQWDGDDLAAVENLNIGGLANANLIHQTGCTTLLGCDRFVATVIQADLGFNYDVGVYTSATQYTILKSGTLFNVTNYTTDWLFSWFALSAGSHVENGLPFDIVHGAGGAADFTDVGAIELKLYNTGICYQSGVACPVSVDLQLDSIAKTVPEPGSVALLGLGLLGLAGLRSRKQKA